MPRLVGGGVLACGVGGGGVAHLSMRNARNTMCTRGTPM